MNRTLLAAGVVAALALAAGLGLAGDALDERSSPAALAAEAAGDAGADGACGEDAADTFEAADPLCGEPSTDCPGSTGPYLCHSAAIDEPGDEDYYAIPLEAGDQLVVDVYTDADLRVRLLDPHGAVVDDATGSSVLQIATSADRVTLAHAPTGGDYRLHVAEGADGGAAAYGVCVRPCEEPTGVLAQGLIGGTPLHNPDDVQVLLVPPSHGDLTNPQGPRVHAYINETVQAIHEWEWALHRFAETYPEYGYLSAFSIEVEVFDAPEATPVDPAGYDVVVGYVASGPAFRGAALCCGGQQATIEDAGLGDHARWEERLVVLSLYAAAPRAGQAAPDFPQRNDLHGVTLHEFGHAFSLGHTWTWTQAHGPDLMNSPASFVYGDGSPVGEGDLERGRECTTTLNLYAMAVVYDWMATGEDPKPVERSGVTLPDGMPYEPVCPPGPVDAGVVDELPAAS